MIKKKQIVCNRLKGVLREKGLTQADLSIHTGLSTTSIYKKLNGLREFKLSEIIQISEWLNIDIKDLFPER